MKMISKFLIMTWIYRGQCITELADMPDDVFGFIYKIQMEKQMNFILVKNK